VPIERISRRTHIAAERLWLGDGRFDLGSDAPSHLHGAANGHLAESGQVRIHFNFPGRVVSDHDDHGYGPLATVVESFMDPGTLIRMHQHRNEGDHFVGP